MDHARFNMDKSGARPSDFAELYQTLLSDADLRTAALLRKSSTDFGVVLTNLKRFQQDICQLTVDRLKEHAEECGLDFPGDLIDSMGLNPSEFNINCYIEQPSHVSPRSFSNTPAPDVFEDITLSPCGRQTEPLTLCQVCRSSIQKKRKCPKAENAQFDRAELKRLEQSTESPHQMCQIPFLAELLYAIASPQSILDLRDSLRIIRDDVQNQLPLAGSTVAQVLKRLDGQEHFADLSALLRRFTLLQLAELRKERYDAEKGCGTISNIERSDVLRVMVREAYPNTSESSGEKFEKRVKRFQNHLSHAQNLVSLVDAFSRGILALLPTSVASGRKTRSVETVPHKMFRVFLEIVESRRGFFLHRLSEVITQPIDSILTEFKTEIMFAFEDLEQNRLLHIEPDSEELLELCKTRQPI